MKTSATIVLAFAVGLSGSVAAHAQTEPPVHHHTHVHHYYGPHHTVHRHFAARGAPDSAVAAQRSSEAVGSSQPSQFFKPYADPGEGDADGLSSDPDDCMKGCIGGNSQ